MTLSVRIILASMGALVVACIIYSSIAGDKKIKTIKAKPAHTTAKIYTHIS